MSSRGPLAVLLALLLVAAPSLAVTGPNGSPQDIPGDGDGNAIALASNADLAFTAGRLAAGADDPGSRTGLNPDLDTWWIWDDDGLQRRSGGADEDKDCGDDGFPDPCTSHVVDLAMSADGTRVVAAVHDQSGDSRILFISSASGRLDSAQVELDDALSSIQTLVRSVAITPDGSRVVAGITIDPSVMADSGELRGYNWAGTSVTEAWSHEVATPVSEVAIDDSGRIAAAGGGQHYRLLTWGGSNPVAHDNEGTVASVDFAASSTDWWSVAGYSGGGIGLYADIAGEPFLNIKPGNSAQSAVAITSDGEFFFAGDASGNLRHFVNRFIDEDATQTQIVNIGPLNGAVRDIALSADDRYIAVAAGNGVYLYRVLPTGIVEVWRDVRANAATEVAISGNGDHVAGLFGASTIVRYVPSHSILVDAPDDPVAVSPGTSNLIDVTYTNNGNRYVDVALAPQVPSGWDQPTATPAQFGLAPGASRLVRLDVQVPDLHPAGAVTMDLRHAATGSIPSDTAIELDVRTVRFWDLDLNNAPNQAIEAGAFIHYNLTAKNVGNAEDTTDVVATVDLEGWSIVAEPSTLTLPAGSQAEINITLTAPPSAANLETARVGVSLSADPVAALSLTATVGARFGVSASASVVGASSVVAGEVAQVRVAVTNQGNAPDSYLVTPGSLPIGWSAQATSGESPIRIENVEPGTTVEVLIDVATASFALEGNYQVPFGVSSIGDPSKTTTAQALLGVQEAGAGGDGDGDGDNGTPAPGLLVLLAALAIALVARRRSR